MGISISVVSRDPKEGQMSYNDLDEKIMSEHLLIVNTSPVGTYPEVKRAPDIPYEFLGSSHILHDLVYNPEESLFMKKGKERGARVKNGYQMLVEQAEKSWEIWNQ
jgi:shikimate dehydrogenase